MNPKQGRTIGLYTKVSTQEKQAIEKKMKLLETRNQRAYLRKMAVDGYIIHMDMSDVRELVRLLRIVSNNVNQIARRANESRNLYAEDVEDIRQGYLAVWKEIRKLMEKLEI